MNIYDLANSEIPETGYPFCFFDGRKMKPKHLWFSLKMETVSFLWENKFYSLKIDDPLTIGEEGYIFSELPIETKRPCKQERILT